MSTATHTDISEIQSPETDAEIESGLCTLVRSKADAMIVYREANWFSSQEKGEQQYELLRPVIEKWDTPDFTKWDAKLIERLVGELISELGGDLNDEYEGMGYGLAGALLQALVQAAKKKTEVL